jgi:hypothetical protein
LDPRTGNVKETSSTMREVDAREGDELRDLLRETGVREGV